jgi:hypothetical protein
MKDRNINIRFIDEETDECIEIEMVSAVPRIGDEVSFGDERKDVYIQTFYKVTDVVWIFGELHPHQRVNIGIKKIDPGELDLDGFPKQPAKKMPPENKIGATHWAVTPDHETLFYKIDKELFLWFPRSSRWENPQIAPYTLHAFDDHSA